MKLATSRPTTQTERIFALEEARKADDQARTAHGERLEKIETKLDDIYGLLVKGRNIKWAFDGLCKYAGQISMLCGVLYAAWKFTGH